MIAALRSSECVASVLATSRHGTPLRAATAMSCAPSTVYRAIARLDKEIGVPLFDRTPEGWVPTYVGTRIIGQAETIEREAAATDLLVLGGNAGFSGPLRVSASDGLAEGYLVPVLATFSRTMPSLAIELVVDNQFADLRRRAADIAVRPSRRPGEDLVGQRAGKLAHALYGAAPLLKKRGMPSSPSDLARHEACVLADDLVHHTAAKWWSKRIKKQVKVSFIANTEMSLAAAIAAGMGIGILPCFLGDRLGGVTRVKTLPVGPPVDIWLVTHRALRRNPVVQGLIRALAAAMRRDGPMLAGAGG
ncbi:MAG TPA: LysR family transcriptional regulator [Xanthobacteraceae bacterium]